jgi:alkylated DNA repair dioxygenase AlkB
MKNKFPILIDEEFRSLIPPMSADSLAQLEANIRADGLRNKIIVVDTPNGFVILDGRHRFEVMKKLAAASVEEFGSFKDTVLAQQVSKTPDRWSVSIHDDYFEMAPSFDCDCNRDAIKLWILQNQVGRRNLTKEQRLEMVAKIVVLRQEQSKAVSKANLKKGDQAPDVGKMPTSGKTVKSAAKEFDVPEKPLQAAVNAANGKPYPKYEYVEGFVSSEECEELIQKMEQSEGWLEKETGSCTVPPSHATIHWGPRQAYLDCVPTEYRAKSSGEIPEFLIPLQKRLENKYDCVFNSAQVNKHFGEDAVVHAHTDSNAGHISMISLGAERDFVLKSFAHGRKEFARLKQASGSLLTFFPKEQHKHTHEMPKSPIPCGVRYSIIFRHIQPVLTVSGNLTKKVNGTTKEKRDIRTQRELEYEAGQNGEPMPPPLVLDAPPQPPATDLRTGEDVSDAVANSRDTITLTHTNIDDTRFLSMAKHRLKYTEGKVQLLVKALDDPEFADQRELIIKTLATYRQAYADFSKFTAGGIATIDKALTPTAEPAAVWMRHGKPSTVKQCRAKKKKNSLRCQNEAFENGYCGQHKSQAEESAQTEVA